MHPSFIPKTYSNRVLTFPPADDVRGIDAVFVFDRFAPNHTNREPVNGETEMACEPCEKPEQELSYYKCGMGMGIPLKRIKK